MRNHYLTPEEAQDWLCPFARTFSITPASTGCHGPSCALWRWEKITTAHPKWRDAVLSVAKEMGDKPPYAKASAKVACTLA